MLTDAVLVTHALGLHFIWIDALCIIQDSTADKEREIRNMYAIYENSFITISASTSSSVETGFLNLSISSSDILPSCAIPMPLHNQNGKEDRTDVTFIPRQTQHTDACLINERG
jgi:hypothetical protein